MILKNNYFGIMKLILVGLLFINSISSLQLYAHETKEDLSIKLLSAFYLNDKSLVGKYISKNISNEKVEKLIWDRKKDEFKSISEILDLHATSTTIFTKMISNECFLIIYFDPNLIKNDVNDSNYQLLLGRKDIVQLLVNTKTIRIVNINGFDLRGSSKQ